MKIVRKIRAILFLARHLLLSLLGRWILQNRRGLKQFRTAYLPDRIVSYTPEEKRLLPLFSRCLQCGLCDSLCPVTEPSSLISPSSLPFLSRSIPNFSGLQLKLERCGSCRDCESICPTQVPIRRLIEFVRHHGS